MRSLNLLNAYRITGPDVVQWMGYTGDDTCGVFTVPSPIDRAPMTIIASSDLLWDHVSVSRRNRSPNQTELDHVFRLFFREDETAVQFFVPKSEHVNNMPHCLHLFRPQNTEIPKPPSLMVGIGDKQPTTSREALALRDEALARFTPPTR